VEREANYAAVGAFVLLVALLGALFVYWYSDAREHRSYNRYEILLQRQRQRPRAGRGGALPSVSVSAAWSNCTSTRAIPAASR